MGSTRRRDADGEGSTMKVKRDRQPQPERGDESSDYKKPVPRPLTFVEKLKLRKKLKEISKRDLNIYPLF
jgi:hypothetical protein